MFREACRLSGRKGTLVHSDAADIEGELVIEHDDVQVVEEEEAERKIQDLPVSHTAVPEHSHTGESQTNGLAERAVQSLEDHVRVLKVALEARLGTSIPVHHPVVA